MTATYSNKKICPYESPLCNLESEGLPYYNVVREKFRSTLNPEEMLYYWHKTHVTFSDPPTYKQYQQYIKLLNQIADTLEYDNAGIWWQSQYEDSDIVKIANDIWSDIIPLYQELHKYMKRKLLEMFKNGKNAYYR